MFGCKAIFREEIQRLEIDKIYEKILKQSGSASGSTDAETLTKLNSEIINDVYDLSIKLMDFSQTISYDFTDLNTKIHLDDRLNACLLAIYNFYSEEWTNDRNIYDTYGRYYEPKRNLSQIPLLIDFSVERFKDQIQQWGVEFSYNELRSLFEKNPLAASDLPPGVSINEFLSGIQFSEMKDLEMIIHSQEIERIPGLPLMIVKAIENEVKTGIFSQEVNLNESLNLTAETLKRTFFVPDFTQYDAYKSRNGLPGHYVPLENFEKEWESLFQELTLAFRECGINYEGFLTSTSQEGAFDIPLIHTGAIPGYNSNIKKCVRSQLNIEGNVEARVLVLVASFTLLDMAGTAFSEGDENSAQELLTLAREVFKFSANVAIGLTPAGRAKDIIEGLWGHSIIPPDFEQLSPLERTISVLGAVTIGGSGIEYIAKYIGKTRILKRLLKSDPFQKTILNVRHADEIFDSVINIGWKGTREGFEDLRGVVKSLKEKGKLPDHYITKNEAEVLGWNSKSGNLGNILPGKQIGGDVYKNRSGKLPPGKYFEADLGYRTGYRGKERIIYSKDSSVVYLTSDHFENFIELKL